MDEILNKLGITLDFEFILVFWSLIWIRLVTIFSLVPFLFGKPVPRKVMVGAATVVSFFLYFHLKPAVIGNVPENMIVVFALYFKEIFIGLVIGLTASLLFYGFEGAGRMVDNQRGASLARVLIPQLGTQGSLSGQLLFQMAIVLYLVFGGHLIFLNSVFESYQMIPVLEFPNVQPGLYPLMDFMIRLSAEVLKLSIQIAAPVIIAILMADLILGLTNRVAPQINVWELGFNIKGFIGILMLFFAFSFIARQMYVYTVGAESNTKKTIQLLQGHIPEDMKDVKTPPELQNIFSPTGEKITIPKWWDTTIRSIKPLDSGQ